MGVPESSWLGWQFNEAVYAFGVYVESETKQVEDDLLIRWRSAKKPPSPHEQYNTMKREINKRIEELINPVKLTVEEGLNIYHATYPQVVVDPI
jgi:hypothetical protein